MEAVTIAAMATATAAMRGRAATGGWAVIRGKGQMNCRGMEKRLLIGRAHGRS